MIRRHLTKVLVAAVAATTLSSALVGTAGASTPGTPGTEPTLAERSLQLPNAKNARDVGGYRTTDGKWVRTGVAFRSGQLSGLTAAEWSTLTGLGVDQVVDLRNVSERREAAYTPPAGVGYQVADVFALPPTRLPSLNGLVSTVLCANPSVALNAVKILATVDEVDDALTGASYPLEACYHGAMDAFHDVLTAMASEKTVLVHCSAGKDRTGVAVAILQTVLGVPRQTVIDDFLLSNTYRGPGSVQREWIEGWFSAVTATWGTFGNFVKYGLGISDATVARLKAKFLTTV